MSETKILSFLMALRTATSPEGETLSEFSAQYKKLTDDDKRTLDQWLTDAGIAHEPAKVLVTSSDAVRL